MTISLVQGLILGTAVSIFNHWIVVRALKKIEGLSVPQLKKRVYSRYLIRYAVIAAVLFLVYRYFDVYMLIATALGMTVVKNYLAVKHFIIDRKG